MNGYLVAAAGLSGFIGVVHSWLGEVAILMPLLRSSQRPRVLEGDFKRRTLRFAWHLTSVAWWGFSALFLALAQAPVDATGKVVLEISMAMFVVTGACTGLATGGRHLAWPLFLGVALLAWLGIT